MTGDQPQSRHGGFGVLGLNLVVWNKSSCDRRILCLMNPRFVWGFLRLPLQQVAWPHYLGRPTVRCSNQFFYPSDTSGLLKEPITEAIEDVVLALNGSFSAELSLGLSKKSSMARRKDPIALEMMSAIKTAFDPKNLMNLGKVYPVWSQIKNFEPACECKS